MFAYASIPYLVLAASLAVAAPVAAPSSAIGLLVDSASAQRAQAGLLVLGATPGSLADRLGLRPGDLITRVNGIPLANLGADTNGHALAASAFRSSVAELPTAAPLRLSVLRDGVTVAMNAPLHDGAAPVPMAAAPEAPATAATEGCGRISTFDVAPRNKHQYRAIIVLLDGQTPGPSGAKSFRVNAGTHTLLVAEDIPTREMGVGFFASLRTRRDNSKQIAVTVKPNTTSMLAAQLHPDKAADFAQAAYWDPVVWREIPERCP